MRRFDFETGAFYINKWDFVLFNKQKTNKEINKGSVSMQTVLPREEAVEAVISKVHRSQEACDRLMKCFMSIWKTIRR